MDFKEILFDLFELLVGVNDRSGANVNQVNTNNGICNSGRKE